MQLFSGKIKDETEGVTSTVPFLTNSTNGVLNMAKNSLPKNKSTNKICSVEGCGSDYKILKSFCNRHYLRFKKYGDVHFTKNTFGNGKTREERFWSLVDKTSNPKGCWEWTVPRKSDGYIRISVNHKLILAHVYSWFLANKRMPTKLILHWCDNRKCVNPEHLREGTFQDNMDDRAARNRTAKGERSGKAKLTEKDVIEVRRLLGQSVMQKDIAKRFGVTAPSVSAIKRGLSWKHL